MSSVPPPHEESPVGEPEAIPSGEPEAWSRADATESAPAGPESSSDEAWGADRPSEGPAHSAPRPAPPLDGSPAPVDEQAAAPATVEGLTEPDSAPTPVPTPEPVTSSTPSPETAALAAPVTATGETEAVAYPAPTPSGVGAGAPAPTAPGTPDASPARGTTPAPPAEEVFPEDSWPEEPGSRLPAHLWSALSAILLAPVTWFLLTDGALRTFYSLERDPGAVNIAGLIELGAGIIALIALILVMRWSTLGAFIVGSLTVIAGLAFLVFPVRVVTWLEANREAFLFIHDGFGSNVYNHLLDTGRSGLLLVFGVVILVTAFTVHGARRLGRKEGLAPTRKERRKAKKEAARS